MQQKIVFLGDISLNDKYNELYINNKKPFKKVNEILSTFDFVIGNLECLSEGDKGENLLKNPRLKTKTETLNYLKDLNIKLVLLAHNHIYDNLEDGLKKTLNFLENNNIEYIGAGLTPEEAEKPFIKKINNHNICILNYVTEDTNPNLPKDATVFPNWFNENKVISDIKKYKKTCDQIILCLHWGGKCEGGKFPDWEQPKIAKRLINAGADIIIGNHSHTIQPFEKYKNKHIYYSLGNFCFSPLINSKYSKLVPTARKGLGVIYSPSDKKFSYLQFINNNLFLDYKKISFKNNVLFYIIFRNKLLWFLYYIYIEKIQFIIYFIFYYNGSIWYKLKSLNLKKIIKYLKVKK